MNNVERGRDAGVYRAFAKPDPLALYVLGCCAVAGLDITNATTTEAAAAISLLRMISSLAGHDFWLSTITLWYGWPISQVTTGPMAVSTCAHVLGWFASSVE
jgi:hypothetical protein